MKRLYIFCILLFFSAFPFNGFAVEKAHEYFKAGISFYDQENYDQALGALQKATQADPNFAEAYYNLGIIYDLQGKFVEAIKAYEAVIQIDPNVGAVWENLAQDCYAVGEVRRGMDYLKLAESLGKPVDKELYNQMWATVKYEIKEKMISAPTSESKPLKQLNQDLELAVISLEKELEQKAGKSKTLINLGIKYRQRGEIDKSIDIFTKSLSMNINKPMILAELGLCYYFKDQKDLFVQHFEKAKQGGFKPSKSLNDLYLQHKTKK